MASPTRMQQQRTSPYFVVQPSTTGNEAQVLRHRSPPRMPSTDAYSSPRMVSHIQQTNQADIPNAVLHNRPWEEPYHKVSTQLPAIHVPARYSNVHAPDLMQPSMSGQGWSDAEARMLASRHLSYRPSANSDGVSGQNRFGPECRLDAAIYTPSPVPYVEPVVVDGCGCIDRVEARNVADKQGELVEALKAAFLVPRVGVLPFTGSPLEFHAFMDNFVASVSSKLDNNKARVEALISNCTGSAREEIELYVNLPEEVCYTEAVNALARRFGKPEHVVDAVTRDLFDGPLLRANDTEELKLLSRHLRNALIMYQRVGLAGELNTRRALLAIVSRLPPYLRVNWARLAASKDWSSQHLTASDLVDLIECRIALEETPEGKLAFRQVRDSDKHTSSSVYHVNAVAANTHPIISCVVCRLKHQINKCDMFLKMSVQERFKQVYASRLCFRCLKQGHQASNCSLVSRCSHPGCSGDHHVLLHRRVIAKRLVKCTPIPMKSAQKNGPISSRVQPGMATRVHASVNTISSDCALERRVISPVIQQRIRKAQLVNNSTQHSEDNVEGVAGNMLGSSPKVANPGPLRAGPSVVDWSISLMNTCIVIICFLAGAIFRPTDMMRTRVKRESRSGMPLRYPSRRYWRKEDHSVKSHWFSLIARRLHTLQKHHDGWNMKLDLVMGSEALSQEEGLERDRMQMDLFKNNSGHARTVMGKFGTDVVKQNISELHRPEDVRQTYLIAEPVAKL